MDTTEIVSLLNSAQPEAYLGPQGIKLITEERAIKKAQIGYSIDKNGANIASNQPGSWQRHWLVIAKDTELGDPYYVEINNTQLPVYTAIFNETTHQWQTTLVATSLTGFVECIDLLFHFTEQDEPKFVPDSTAIFDLEKLEIFGKQLAHISENTDFWQGFFISYVEWLQDENV
ncbi:hypothetical protein [Thalassotalea sp. SU-HH00458]|uniref:hypothetical protein n=1 Tax=Thalassotalea sp. SU-HH00458 TaxID=3127657 RepID=UPI003108D828